MPGFFTKARARLDDLGLDPSLEITITFKFIKKF